MDKLDRLIDKYGTDSVSMTFRMIASNAHLSPHLATEVKEMTEILQEALREYAVNAGKKRGKI
jgi:hypothetical protein